MVAYKIGSTGVGVEHIQKALKDAGFYQSGVDGIYGDQTANAVMNFQAGSGLGADGIVGAATWDKLFPPGLQSPKH